MEIKIYGGDKIGGCITEISSKNTKIIFECGDATLHPEFDKLMYYFINIDMKDITIQSCIYITLPYRSHRCSK